MTSAEYRPVIECGIDYVTATYKPSEVAPLSVQVMGREIQREQERAGNATLPGRMRGYDTWMTGPFTWGTRPDGTLIRVSGAAADSYCNRFPHLLLHATRLDVQVTLYWGDQVAVQHARAKSDAEAASAARPTARRFDIEYWAGTDGLHTVYLGSRSSDHYGRIYNKYLRNPIDYYRDTLRYEIEFKGQLARKLGASMHRIPYQTSYQAGPVVAAWFAARGVRIPAGFPSPYFELPRLDPVAPDNVRQLRWLHDQVRPTVLKLLGGEERSVVEYALGLRPEDADLEAVIELLRGDENAT